MSKAYSLVEEYQLQGSEITLYTTKEYIDIAKFVQSSVSEVGIVCRVEEMMPAALREKRAKCSLTFFRSSWIADYPDAENYLSLFTSENFAPDGPTIHTTQTTHTTPCIKRQWGRTMLRKEWHFTNKWIQS